MTTTPHEGPDDRSRLEDDLLADPNTAMDPEPQDGRAGWPSRGSSDDPQHGAGETRAEDPLRGAESSALHIEADAEDRTRADEGDVEIL